MPAYMQPGESGQEAWELGWGGGQQEVCCFGAHVVVLHHGVS